MDARFQVSIYNTEVMVTDWQEPRFDTVTTATTEATVPAGGREAELTDPAFISAVGTVALLSLLAVRACRPRIRGN